MAKGSRLVGLQRQSACGGVPAQLCNALWACSGSSQVGLHSMPAWGSLLKAPAGTAALAVAEPCPVNAHLGLGRHDDNGAALAAGVRGGVESRGPQNPRGRGAEKGESAIS